METEQALLSRREVRRFLPKEVPEELLRKVLEAGRWAPSPLNTQPWHFIVVRDGDARRKLSAIAAESKALSAHWEGRFRPGGEWGEPMDFTEAPVAIALALDPERAPRFVHGEKLHLVSGGCCLQNILLMAHALGLGANWVSHWIEEEVKILLDIPRKWELAGVVALGYPAAGGALREERAPLAEMVSEERCGSPARSLP